MRKLCAFLLLAALLAGYALAEAVEPDYARYIALLSEAAKAGSGDDAKLDEAYAHFDAREPSSLNSGLKLYIDILRLIEQNNAEALKSSLFILKWSVQFNAWLDDNEYGLPNAAALNAYAQGRAHEANGDFEQALEAYNACEGGFDAADRISRLIITDEAKYALACGYMAEGRYADALPIFEQLAESDYEDSKTFLESLRAYLSLYETAPEPTPTVTPAPPPGDASGADQAPVITPAATPASGAAPKCTHSKTAWRITKQPSCTEQGRRAKVCAACGLTVDSETIAVIEHKYVEINTIWLGGNLPYYAIEYRCEVCGHEKQEKNPIFGAVGG